MAVENTRALAKAKNIPLQTDVFDIADKELENDFDVIIATFVLHELYTDDAVSVIQKIQRHTKPKGLNIIATFTKSGDVDKAKSPRFFVRDNKELESFYSDWTTHFSFERKTGLSQRGPNGEQLFQVFAGLLSQRK